MQSLTTQSVSDQLLANRELLSLERARIYLASRVRVQTPLGAAEFLGAAASHGRETYDRRVSVALDVLHLYRETFPQEYARSSAPAFSTKREQEFYRLVHAKLFPLLLSEEVDILTHMEREPNFFLPFIPVRGTQQHNWAEGCCPFVKLQTIFKLVLVLTDRRPNGWVELSRQYGLKGEIAPPLGAVGWTLFVHSCGVEESALRFFPFAFDMVFYRTGNPWLDLPPVGYVGYPWSGESVAQLALACDQANDMSLAIHSLDQWLNKNPTERIARAVELWNDAGRIEAEQGFTGMLDEDLIRERGAVPVGPGMCTIPGGIYGQRPAQQQLEGNATV